MTNKKVLFVNPPFSKLLNGCLGIPPLGLMYMAAVLKKNKIPSIVFNADYTDAPIVFASEIKDSFSEYKKRLNDLNYTVWKNIKKTIKEIFPDIVAITVWTSAFKSAINIAEIVKNIDKNIIVVMGGIHPTVLPKSLITNSNVDIIVVGEGEETILELVKILRNNGDLRTVKGIYYKKHKKIIFTGLRTYISYLDKLPWPDRESVIYEFDKQDKTPIKEGKILTSRGCPYNCTFCANHTLWGRRVRFRDIKDVVDEIEFMNKKYGTRVFEILDDTFMLDIKRTIMFCKLLRKRKLKIEWNCKTRVNLVTEKIFKELKSAGCTSVAIGVESGNEEMLKKMRKNINLEQVKNVVKWSKKYGIRSHAYFMIGHPGETNKSIKDTENFIKELGADTTQLAIVTPYPGTDVFNIAIKEGLIKDKEWSNFYHHAADKSVMNLKTISNEELHDAYIKLINLVNEMNSNYFTKKIWNPAYIIKNISKEDFRSPKNFIKKIKTFFKITVNYLHK